MYTHTHTHTHTHTLNQHKMVGCFKTVLTNNAIRLCYQHCIFNTVRLGLGLALMKPHTTVIPCWKLNLIGSIFSLSNYATNCFNGR